jgi:uncharacterized membrane protein
VTAEHLKPVYTIHAFIFPGRLKAEAIDLNLARDLSYDEWYVDAHAVVEIDDKGKAHIHEAGKGGRGAGIGFVAGGLLGLIGGPAGLLAWAVAGAVVGGLAGKYGGQAISSEDIERLAARMQPDTSAILMLAAEDRTKALQLAMASYEAEVVTLVVSDEVSGEIHVAMASPTEKAPDGKASSPDIHLATAIPGESHSSAHPKGA